MSFNQLFWQRYAVKNVILYTNREYGPIVLDSSQGAAAYSEEGNVQFDYWWEFMLKTIHPEPLLFRDKKEARWSNGFV